MKRITVIAVAAFAAVTAAATAFIVGMRAKSPALLSAVRRMNKEAINPDQMRTAGTAGASTSVVRHEGRKTGRIYETPVQVIPHHGDFLIMMPYGMQADWVKNMLAAGSGAIVHDGHTYPVDNPEIIAVDTVADAFGEGERRLQRLFAVDQCMRLRKVAAAATPTTTEEPLSI